MVRRTCADGEATRGGSAEPRRQHMADGTLYVWFPDAPVLDRAFDALRSGGHRPALTASCARVALGHGELDGCVLDLGGAITEPEARRARALFVAGEEDPSLDDFGR